MNQLKEKDEERTKEEERENQQLQPRVRYARSCELCFGTMCAEMVFDAANEIKGMTRDEACDWIDYMKEVGWVFTSGNPVNKFNFRRSLRMWHKKNEEINLRHKLHSRYANIGQNFEEMERIKAKIAKDKLAKAMAQDDAWELCEERCAEFRADGCPNCKHWSIPPQLRERPIPPEECMHFKQKGE